ncbi:glycoside hydrolase family 55 protein [Pseudarthrobacter sp. HLT3-5]|uniref:glycoside hydrolase family 55 protein n=1 Tax=Pseudarthrobacter cellobiosi TaxID=2953654 RepID=UPI00208FBC84|nr:glycoside hydrolase family 55 protein [Pseudarthrobacter sp. HLT3-5]MCO4276143.1 glycoside hydrolase family 55 protein [Pseudarthrobacter sp. HLT3-5]
MRIKSGVRGAGRTFAVGAMSAVLLVSAQQPILNADVGARALLSTETLNVAIDPKAAPYNAKGDGVTDDSAALQAWLNAGGTRLASGTYRITKGLILSGDNRRLYTENAKILADGTNITALTVTGSNASISAYIDGNNKASDGVKVTGPGAVLENGWYQNFRSTTQSARGIEARTTGGIIIRNNVIRNVVSVGDTTLGNGNGASRGILLSGPAAATAESVISANMIQNITGEEGDGIQVLFFDGKTSTPFSSGRVAVSDNNIWNVSRRFIKIQASDVTVQGNKLCYYLTTSPANPATSIDIIHSENVKVISNEVNPNLLGPVVIAVRGPLGVPLRGIEVRSNIIRQAATKKSVGIYLTWTTAPIIQGNLIYINGTAIQMSYTTGAIQ